MNKLTAMERLAMELGTTPTKAALDLLGVGESKWDEQHNASELAAWTTVASAILNLDETITKE